MKTIIILSKKPFEEYAKKIQTRFLKYGFYCDINISDSPISEKIKTATLLKYDYIFVICRKEQEEEKISLVNMEHGDSGGSIMLSFEKMLDFIR